jgi:hypothetical protein
MVFASGTLAVFQDEGRFFDQLGFIGKTSSSSLRFPESFATDSETRIFPEFAAAIKDEVILSGGLLNLRGFLRFVPAVRVTSLRNDE